MSLRLVGSGNSVPCLSPVTGGEAKRGIFLSMSAKVHDMNGPVLW